MGTENKYNCPDCIRDYECDDCSRVTNSNESIIIEHIPPYFPDSMVWTSDYSGIPNCCKHCSNHPINGGSGICYCTAPLHENGGGVWDIRCSDTDENKYYIE